MTPLPHFQLDIIPFKFMCCGGLAMTSSQTATQLLTSSHSSRGQGGENRVRKLMAQEKDREIDYQLSLWAKLTQLEEY